MSKPVQPKLESRHQRVNRYYTYEGERPATDSWGRRFLAHVCDVVIVIILGLIMYAILAAISKPLGYSRMSDEYNRLFDEKIQYLIDVGIMEEAEAVGENGQINTFSDREMAKRLVEAYFGVDTLVETDEKGVFKRYKDPLLEFYCNVLGNPDRDGVTVTGVPGYENPYTTKEYFEILEEQVNGYANAEIFVFDETIGPLGLDGQPVGLPKLNDTTIEGRDYSYRDLLFYYLGKNPDTGEEDETIKDTSDVNYGLFSSLAQGYLNMRMDASTIAVSSDERADAELRIIVVSTDMALTKAVCLAVGYMLGFIAYRGVCFPIFKHGRTVAKRVLGYYVVDSKRKKAKWYQLVGRSFVEMLEQYWVVVFGSFMILGTDAFRAPLMKIGATYVTGGWFMLASILLYLASCICAFIVRDNMSSFHDLASHTACICLTDQTFINTHLLKDWNQKQEENEKKESSLEDMYTPEEDKKETEPLSRADQALKNLEGEDE